MTRMKMRLILLACVAVMACGRSTTDASTQFVGTFFMQSVNGNPMPFVVSQDASGSTSLTQDQLTIADGGTWSETGIERTVFNGQVTNNTYSDNGTWSESGSSLVLFSTPNNDTAWSGTIGSNSLQLDQGATIAAVFVRQLGPLSRR
jgi:hypothetical protein